jgi:hypothetical protein
VTSWVENALLVWVLALALSSVVVVVWLAAWIRPGLRPAVVGWWGLGASVAAVVLGVVWPDPETDRTALEDLAGHGPALLLNGMVGFWVSVVLLVVTGVVAVVRDGVRGAPGAR